MKQNDQQTDLRATSQDTSLERYSVYSAKTEVAHKNTYIGLQKNTDPSEGKNYESLYLRTKLAEARDSKSLSQGRSPYECGSW
jgi:hypothetical protein